MIPTILDTSFNPITCNRPSVEPHIPREKAEKILREWESYALPGEKRRQVVTKLLKFYDKETTFATCEGRGDLTFYNYKLRSLPDIFSYLPFRRLTSLVLSGCFLQQLPNSFSQLEELTLLELATNELEEVPPAISCLTNLAELDLSENRLKKLPDNLDLPYLESLNLEQNGFEELPNIISQFPYLSDLQISKNNLRTLPEHFHWPKNLALLSLGDNKLSRLPEELIRLKKLSELFLYRNEFTHISSLLSKFAQNVHIHVDGNQFPEEEVQRIIELTSSPNYRGPVIEGLSVEEEYESELEEEEEEIYDKLHTLAELPPQLFTNLPHSAILQTWLNRLFSTADFRIVGNKKAIAQTVVSILKEANDNEEYRHVFLRILEEASETCGDRVALSLLHLDLAYQIRKVDLTDMEALTNLLIRGVWVIDLLEKQARQKVATLRGVDEIETYLAYPIKLKEMLKIPITLQDMRYFECSALTDEDIYKAYIQILRQINCREACLTFLSKQDEWQRAIALNYPQEWQQLKKEKEQAIEEAYLPEDYVKIHEEFITKIKNLSSIIYKDLSYKASFSQGLEGTSRQYPSIGIPTLAQDSFSQEASLKRELESPETTSQEHSQMGKKIRLEKSE